MVLVHVTAFKDRHKIQGGFENREYVVEWQPYPNLPVYMVCPIDVEWCSHTLHRNYLLPISNNLEEGECENSVWGDGHSGQPNLMPHGDDVLPVKCPAESQLGSMPNKQHEPFNPGSAAWSSMDSTDEGLQADNDTPVPLK